ncbi:hypothetical protein PIB30_049441 [Stylosanthes scabra]|uniref:Reverse transcriptase zinc-binding domain-containing protein n=1 Tax=Stylosanthes scabra TaxID=79078 RepID=A0ABU6TI54_9FABA|nr:hypothetical protein [Stylosanthes scabra]
MEGSLAKDLPFVHISDTNLQIQDVWDHGNWNMNRLSSILPEEVKQNIGSYNPLAEQVASSGWFWSSSSSKIYYASSGYRWLCNRKPFRQRPFATTSLATCSRCYINSETSLHCLRDCHLSQDIWCKLGYDSSQLDMRVWAV